MKTALGETQTLRAGHSNVEPKNFARRRPLPGVQGGQNLISWTYNICSLDGHYLHLQTQFGENQINACNFELSW